MNRGFRFAAAAALAWLAAHASAAPVEIRYGDAEDARITMHGRDAGNVSPVVVRIGPPDPELARVLAARGYAYADVPVPAGDDAYAATARALLRVAEVASQYGGDPHRLYLIGDSAGAALAARLAADVDEATRHRVQASAIVGVALRGGRGYALTVSQATAPTLVLHARDDAIARRDGERYVARLREVGSRAETLAVDGSPLRADAELVAWLATAAVARLGRFEQLAFEHQADVPASLVALAAHDGALYGGASASPRVLRKRGADTPWATDHDFGDGYDAVVALASTAQGVCAAVRDDDGALSLSCRDADGKWRAPVALPLRDAPVVTIVDAPPGNGTRYVASGTRIARLSHGTKPRVDLEAEAPVVALAVADDRVYAAIGGESPAILLRDADAADWQRVAPIAATALAAVPDPEGAGHAVLLAASPAGIDRLDPGRAHARTREIDFAAAFAGALGEQAVVAEVGTGGFAALPHPQSNDLVHAIGVALDHPDRGLRGAYYLVRQLDGSYAYALARDFLAPRERRALARIRAIASSPFEQRPGIWLLGRDASGGAALASGALATDAAREAIWWDRTRPGHGVALHPAGDGWLAMLYSYDADGEPVWYLAVGEIAGARFVPDSNGLARYRLGKDASVPSRVVERSGAIEIRFDGAAASAACRAASRDGAEALALMSLEIDGRRTESCLEPIAYGPRGLPGVETSGAWQPAGTDRSFGLLLAPQGYDGHTHTAALVYYYDADGEPRWALGAAPSNLGAAAIELSSFTAACLGCDPAPLASKRAGTLTMRMNGFCGQVSGSASVTLEYAGEAGGQLVRRNVALERLSRARCY